MHRKVIVWYRTEYLGFKEKMYWSWLIVSAPRFDTIVEYIWFYFARQTDIISICQAAEIGIAQ